MTTATVDRVAAFPSPGVYLLGRTYRVNAFTVFYVGRSDADINNQLKSHISSYTEFKFEYCSSSREAFERECDLYHTLEPPDNKAHPVRPKGASFGCPRCRAFG